MDRREALKKLGVGSAVAVGGPLILQSYAVAAGASQMPSATTVDNAAGYTRQGGPNLLQITFTTNPFPAGTTFLWTYVSGPVTSFAPTNTLATEVTASANVKDVTFALNLAATHPGGDTVNYLVTWDGTATTLTVS